MYKNFKCDESISPEDARQFEKSEKDYYSNVTTFVWREKTIVNNPMYVTICGDNYKQYVDSILKPIDEKASSDKEAFEMLYATQGYTKEDLDKDIDHPNFSEFLSSLIEMNVADIYHKKEHADTEENMDK